MRTRAQTIKDLSEAQDFTDSEIAINSTYVRDLFDDALGHVKDAAKIVAENRRQREHIRQLKAHIGRTTPQVARWEWYEEWGPSTWLEPPDLNNAGWKCSNCGIDLGDYLTDCLGVNVYVDEEDKMPKIKSCPHCGAKMDGGDPHD